MPRSWRQCVAVLLGDGAGQGQESLLEFGASPECVLLRTGPRSLGPACAGPAVQALIGGHLPPPPC